MQSGERESERKRGTKEVEREGKSGHTEMRAHKDDSRNAIVPLWERREKAHNNSADIVWAYFTHNCLEALMSPSTSYLRSSE